MHSILIPHRNYNAYLDLCLWSIYRSAQRCEIPANEWRVWVIDCGSETSPLPSKQVSVCLCPPPPPGRLFNKPLALNVGIELALKHDKADVLTFLDADAIVGLRWLENTQTPWDATRLCYRVRKIPKARFQEFYDSALKGDGAVVADAFEHYNGYSRAFEAYRQVEHNADTGLPVFGNSQFSIRADVLGDLRFNESLEGRGFEDLWLIREIWRKYGDAYRGIVAKDADHAMFHVQNDKRADDWAPVGQDIKNYQVYRKT